MHLFSRHRTLVLSVVLLALIALWALGIYAAVGYLKTARTQQALAVFQHLSQNKKYAFMEALMRDEGVSSVIRLLEANQTPAAGGLTYRFGWDVYQRYGVEGIANCPLSLMLGCRAGILRAALMEHGPSILSQFADACGKGKPGIGFSCGHGIGHGTAELKQFDIKAALAVCDDLASYGQVPCYGGVFQEYLEFAPADRFSEKDLWQPCAGLADQYRSVCAFTLPDLWYTRYHYDDSKAASLCASSADEVIRKNCMLGVGFRIVKEVKGDSAQIITRCTSLFSESTRPLCYIGAANVLGVYRYPDADTRVAEVCSHILGALRDICVHASKIHTDFGTDSLLTNYSF